MRKCYFIIIAGMILNSTSLLAQVGINISNPQGIFHIDSQSNTISSNITDDDVIVTADGKVGIGTVTPSEKLDIHGNLRIVDGLQGENKRLTSDANGLAIWKTMSNPVKIGVLSPTGINLTVKNSDVGVWIKTPVELDIPAGSYLIAGSFRTDVVGLIPTGSLEIFYSWSDNPTAYVSSSANFHYEPTGGGGYVTTPVGGTCPMVINSGYWMIKNLTAGSLRLYLYVTYHLFDVADNSVILQGLARDYEESLVIVYPLK